MANRLVITLLVYEPCRSETRVLLCLPTFLPTGSRESHRRGESRAGAAAEAERAGRMGQGRRPVARFPRTYYPVVRVPAGEGAPPAAGAGRGAPLPPPKPPAPRGPAADPTSGFVV